MCCVSHGCKNDNGKEGANFKTLIQSYALDNKVNRHSLPTFGKLSTSHINLPYGALNIIVMTLPRHAKSVKDFFYILNRLLSCFEGI